VEHVPGLQEAQGSIPAPPKANIKRQNKVHQTASCLLTGGMINVTEASEITSCHSMSRLAAEKVFPRQETAVH
jgi:hypothetical protein